MTHVHIQRKRDCECNLISTKIRLFQRDITQSCCLAQFVNKKEKTTYTILHQLTVNSWNQFALFYALKSIQYAYHHFSGVFVIL